MTVRGMGDDDAASMLSAPQQDRRLRAKRIAIGFVTAIAVAFIGSSAAQIVPAVFGVVARAPPAAVAQTLPGAPERDCADVIRGLSSSLDRLYAKALAETDADSALARFRADWESAAGGYDVCARAHGGSDAWAALLRLQRAQEQSLRRTAADLGPLRRDVSAHLPDQIR